MDGPLCVIKDRLFIAKAKQLNLSEAALEGIVHKYINKRGNANDFPSDAYIMAQYAVQNIVSKEDVEELTTVWKEHFSTPITVDTLEEAELLKQEAQKYFKQEAVTIIPTNDGNYMVKVAQPKVASTNVARPNGPIVFNEEQRNAINKAVAHINSVRAGKTQQKFFLIKGKAGTGKTTIVNEILKGMTTGTSVRPVVLFGAPSHKATSVLTNKINAPGFTLMNKSLAAMLGLKPNNEGEYVPDKSKTPPIKSASVVIIDEASMIGEEQFELIQEALKGKNIPVIFLGDTGQLPPVRKSRYYSNKKINPDKLSPVFEDETISSANLETRVRQGEDSPVLDYADDYWNFSQERTEEYPNDLNTKSRVTDKGALIVQRNEIDLVEQLLPLFEEAKRAGNPNLVKIVTYTNDTVDNYNSRIRKALYPNQDIKGFVKGDLIIFNDTYGDENGAIPNSLESAVIEVRPCPSSLPQIEGLELEEVERELITFKGPYGYNAEVPALIPTKKNRDKHQKNITSLGKYCKQHPNKWYLYWQYKNLYAANIGYAYAIDSHKSQGSTYDIVAVDAADINSVYPTTLKTKAQSVYTAITRASNVTIISSNTTNEGTIYTDIKAINDRINAVKDGTASDEEFIPATEEEFFTEVTEDDIEGLVKDPDRKKKFIKKRGKVDDKEYNKIVTGTIIDEEDDGEAESWSDEWADDDEEDEEEAKPKAKSLTPKERAYDQFVSAQKQLNSTIEFNKKSHTYVVNGRKADFSVTEFRDFVLGKKKSSNDFLEISSRLGDSHDAFLRDYFADTIKDSYPNLSANQIKKLRKQASKLETLLEKTFGEDAIFITDENLLKTVATVTYDGEQYTVAGTMDMVVIDKEGKIHIVDFKTKRANKSDAFSSGTLDEYGFQVSMYKAMVSSTSKLEVGKTVLAQFNLKYADPRTTTYSFKGDQIYVEVEGEDIKIEEADADIFSSGVFTDKLIGLSSDLANNYDVKVSQLKTNIQKQVEHKQVADRTKVTPKRGTGRMDLFYVQDGKSFKRKGIKAVSTLGAILEGKRTSTTRVDNWDYWKKFKVGDIITFHDKNGTEVEVRITVAPHKIDENIDLDEWSEKEGWLPEVFTDMPMKRGKTLMYYAKRGEAFQFEYELASKSKNSDTSSDTIEVNSTVPKWKLLSNFGNKPFKVETESGATREFKTVEHYFQWAKAIHCKNFAMANKILNADTAMEAKKLGSHVLKMSETQIKSWDKISRNVMRKGMRLAFEQNKNAKELLLSTGNALLTHKLGGPFADILMELREEFGGTGKPTTIKEAEKEGREKARKSKEVPEAPTRKSNSNSEWTRRGDKQIKISTEGYRKGDPQDNPDVAYVFTENAQAASNLYEGAQGYASEVDAQNPKLKLAVSDVKGTNQAGIRMGSDGKAYPNTYGIVVKKKQQDEDGKWLSKEGQFEDTDEDFEIFKKFNNFFFDRLDEAPQKKIIFPSQMALGKAALPKRFAKWLANELKTRYGIVSTIQENENSDYDGYGLSIDSIQEKKVDSNLHLEKIDDRYTPKANSDNEHFNATAESLRQKGWHVEFYSKKSKDGSTINEVMTISIEGNPKKGFFELVSEAKPNRTIVTTPLKPEFKGKLIFAQSGTGKTTIADNINVIDSDYLLAEILDVPTALAGDAFNLLKPEEKKEISKKYEEAIQQKLNEGKTVITSRINSLADADFVFYHASAEIADKKTSESTRTNPFRATDYQKSIIEAARAQKEQSADKSKFIELSEDEYLGDTLLTNPKFNIGEENIRNYSSLEEAVKTFLSNFGVTFEELDAEGYSIDYINKVIKSLGTDSLAEGAGEFIAFMMQYNGQEKSIITELAIEDGAVKREDIYDAKGRIRTSAYKSLDKSKYFKLVGKAIKTELEEQFNAVKQGKSIKEKKADGFLDKIRKIIEDFLNFITKNQDLLDDISFYSNYVATNVLYNNEALIKKSLLKPGDEAAGKVEEVNLEKALDEHPYERDLIEKLSSIGMTLAGSAAMSTQITIYRPKENPLHDLDFAAPGVSSRKELEEKLNTVFPNIEHVRTIDNDGASTETYLTFNVPFIIERPSEGTSMYVVRDARTKEPIASFVASNLTILKKGVQGKFLDFFLGGAERRAPIKFNYKGSEILLSDYRDSFEAKLGYARLKDIWDYNRFKKKNVANPETTNQNTQEPDSYSVHFKTKSKKAMNESDFAEEALEDSEKEEMFKALIYAIPEGAQVSTRGTLSKGGIAALDNLGSRSNGALEKVGDRLAKDSDGNNTRIPIYKKLSEDEIAEASVKKIRKQVIATRKPSLDSVEEGFFGIEESNETDERFTTMVKLSVPKVARGVLTGSADAVIIKQIQSLPYSALVSLDTSVVNANFLYALDELLKNPNLHVVPTNEVVTLDPNSLEGMMAKEYAKAGKRLEYDSKTGKLKIPKFTTGYSIRDIEKAAMYDKLINNELLTQEELRTLSKATMYKLSEFITMIQSNKNGYKKILGKDSDKDFTQMSRIQIIEEIGLTPLLNEIKERIFNSAKRPDDTPISTLDKLDIIYDNWEAFIELGYDSLIGLEEIALDNNQHLAKDIKNDLDNNKEDSEDVIQEIYGSSVEHWQVGFRQVSAFNSLSKIIKRAVDSLYELDEDGNLIFDEFGIAKHLNAQVAVSKILHYTQGARSLDDVDAEGNLRKSSMLYMLKNNLSAEPWLQQVIDLLEDKYNEDGDIIKKADEQFKAQFYSNFKKYFQKYAITFKKSYTDKATGAKVETVLMKIINEHQYADTLIKESQAKENSFAIGGFKLKTKNGDINQENLAKLKAAFDKLTKFKEKAGNPGKLSELFDLEDYHKTIKEIFDLLDIDTPADESLYNLFGVKRNLNELHQHLKHLIPSIKDGVTITDNRDYKQIVDLSAKEMGLEMESVSYEAGKMYYSHVLPSYLGRLVTNLTSENMTPEEYKNFLQKEYLKYAWFKKDGKIRCRWLDRLSRSKEVRENFEHTTSLHYLGTEYSDKSPMEYIASMMRMYFFDNNKKWAYFRVPMISNKPSEEYIKFERITTMFRETIAGYMEDVFMQELDRIQAVKERKQNINSDQRIVSKGKKETFDTRGEQFVFEDYLNKYLDGTFNQREEYKELSEEEQLEEQQFSLLLKAKVDGTLSEEGDDYARLRTLFKTITTRCIEENYQVARAQWVDEGFITLKPDGSIKSIAGGLKLSEEQLREFFWNDMFASIQILELTITDMAYYVDTEDLQKRLAELHAPGMQAYIKARDKKGNLYTKDGIERAIYIKDDMVKSSMLANLKKAREQILLDTPKDRRQYVAKQLDSIIGAFQKVNFADAQGYSCPSSYRKKMGVFGNWDDRMEEAYQKVIHPEKYPDVNLSEMLDVLWQPLKPFVYTQIEKPGYNSVLPTLKVSVQNKLSEYALVMADALLQRAGMPNKLRAIYEFMEESQHNPDGTLNGEGIDTIMFMSAVNAGCMGVIDLNDVKDKEGNVVDYRTEEEVKEALSKAYTLEDGKMVYSPDYVHEIPFEDYIIQQNVPAHFMEHEQAHGSQDRILTFADMLDVDPKTGETNYLIIDGEKVSVAEAKKNYFEAIAENINDSVNELIKRFKLENEDPRARNVALSKVLVDTILKDSRYGADLLWACKTNKEGEFNIPLSDPIHSNRIQQLLNSIIKNTINKQEIAGGPVVQVSNWGVSDKLHVRFKNDENKLLLTEDEFNNLKDPFPDDSLTPRDYKNHPERWKQVEDFEDYDEYTGDQAGVAYFEALAPVPDENYFKDFTKKDKNGNEYIDIEEMEKVNPDLLYMIGYRIPTESKYSMVPIKIVGFLPRTGGEGLMLPADITSLAGSDFDIDKEYIMRFVFDRIEKDGKVTYEKPKSGRGYRNNLIIATQLAVLRSEQVQKQLFTPGNFDEPKKYGYLINYVQNRAAKTGEGPKAIWEEAMKVSEKMSVDDFNDWLKKKNKTPMNLIFNHVQVQFHKQNMTAGKLIGIFAQANVSHAFISLVEDTKLAIPVENSFTLNDIKVEGNFLIDEILTKDRSINISNNLAALLAASVDAVKDPILNLININIDTANVVAALLRMGFTLETVSLLASQPVLKKLVRDFAIAKAEGKYPKMRDLISEAIGALPADITSVKEIHVTNEELAANLNGDSPLTNYMVLQIFSRMQDIADTFGDITHMTRYNSITSAVGPFATDTMLQRIKDKAFMDNPMITESIIEACNNPILYAFRDVSERIERRLLGENLIQAGGKFEIALRELGTKLGFSRGVPAKIANAFSDFYMSFYVNDSAEDSVFDLSFENRKRVLTEFPANFLRLKRKYKGNLLINSIQYAEEDAEEFPILKLKTRGLSSTTIEDIKNAWITLYNNADSRDLAISIAEYNYFRGSFGFSPKTFMNLTPNIIKNGFNAYINVLNKKSSYVETIDRSERIINQFILHHPELITDNFYSLNKYNPSQVEDDVYGTCISIDRKPEEEEEDSNKKKAPKPIMVAKPFLRIDGKTYFVVKNDLNSSSIILKEVDELGGDGQGCELSVNENFPKTIYSESKSTRKDRKNSDEGASQSKEILDKDALGVLLDQLFDDDKALEEVLNLSAKQAVKSINTALEEQGKTVRLSSGGRQVNMLVKVLENVEGIDNPREVLNDAQGTLEDALKDLCS